MVGGAEALRILAIVEIKKNNYWILTKDILASILKVDKNDEHRVLRVKRSGK